MDNDCDGDIDEELCTGANLHTDTDLDGQIDEDCAINREIGHGMCSTCTYTYTYRHIHVRVIVNKGHLL